MLQVAISEVIFSMEIAYTIATSTETSCQALVRLLEKNKQSQ